MCRELLEVESVENALFGYATLAGHEDAPLDIVYFFGRMGIRVDAEQAAQLQGALAPAPVHVETPRVSVDFDGDAMLCASAQDALHIDLVAGPSQQLAAGDVPEDCGVGVFDRFHDAVGLFLFAHSEFAMNTRDHEIEGLENVIGIVERAVAEDVGVDPLE